jgi:hypothetical protein
MSLETEGRDWQGEAETRAARSAEASRIFNTEIVQEFLENIEKRCWSRFRESSLSYKDDEQRLRIRMMLDVLDSFKQHFSEYESDASLAKRELETFAEKRERNNVTELARYGL